MAASDMKKPTKNFVNCQNFATYKMPHSTFKARTAQLSLEVAKCPCGQTFVFASDRDQDMKFRMHNKVCPKQVEGYKQVRVLKKAMARREQQHNKAEKLRRVHKHH